MIDPLLMSTPEVLIELENRHIAMALEEIEAHKLQGLPVTPEVLNELEKKHIAMVLGDIAPGGYAKCSLAPIPRYN